MTDSVNIRELVLGLLLQITRDGEYSHIALAAVLNKYQYLDKKERAFITRVTEGTLEHQIELDYIINQFSNTKVNKMKPVIRCIIRSSVYELKYMDSIPASATCNEAVKLVKKKGFKNLTGFVNGVLRNISRNLDQVEYPKKEDQLVYSLSVRYSIPEWMVQQWLQTYTESEVEQMLKSFQTEAPISIRTNLTCITPEELKQELEQEGIEVQQNEELPYAFFIVGGLDYLSSLQAFQKGHFYVQNVSSMKVAEAAEPKEGDYVIDVCAAPGGKSIHIAEKLRGTGLVDARDLTEYKVNLIEQNMKRCGIQNMKAGCQDARILDPDSVGKADIVIADLPCSGLGVMRRKKDIRYKMTPEKQEELVLLQREIVQVVQNYVRPGGKLIYSTCTISQDENQKNVDWFLKQHPEYTCEFMEQMLPLDTTSDGFFVAKMIRQQ